MADEIKNDAWHVELYLRVILHYTEEEIAEVWEKQLLPNRIENGVRVVDKEEAMDFCDRQPRKRWRHEDGS